MPTPIAPLSFPPLLRGEPVRAQQDPFAKAVAMASAGADPGLLTWSADQSRARAAVVLSPEMPLRNAIGAVFAAGIGLSDSLGALAPPEVAVHFEWPDRIKVNGALCGKLLAASATDNPDLEPDWLVLGIDLPVMPLERLEPGQTPDQTTLWDEGCSEITSTSLIESWSRHFLVWINTFMEDGMAPLHRDWCGRCDTIGETITIPVEGKMTSGTFVGLDETGGMLLRSGDTTHAIALTRILEIEQ